MIMAGFSRLWNFKAAGATGGSYLNIGMRHLWNGWEYLFPVCGTREDRGGDMGRYRGNVEIFQQEITSLAETALERVLERV